LNTVCPTQLSFANLESKAVVANFEGGWTTSDADWLLLREINRRVGATLGTFFTRQLPRSVVEIPYAKPVWGSSWPAAVRDRARLLGSVWLIWGDHIRRCLPTLWQGSVKGEQDPKPYNWEEHDHGRLYHARRRARRNAGDSDHHGCANQLRVASTLRKSRIRWLKHKLIDEERKIKCESNQKLMCLP
jgi:hypothetical protein